MASKSYYEIAINDLGYLYATLQIPRYNNIASGAQQIAEKLLKSVAELELVDTKLLQSHNLKAINAELLNAGVDLGLEQGALSLLKDVYFEARYPGDNYVDVSRADCDEYLTTMYNVLVAVNKYRKAAGLSTVSVDPAKTGKAIDILSASPNNSHQVEKETADLGSAADNVSAESLREFGTKALELFDEWTVDNR